MLLIRQVFNDDMVNIYIYIGMDLGGGPWGPGPPGSFFFLVIIFLIFVVRLSSKTLGLLFPK